MSHTDSMQEWTGRVACKPSYTLFAHVSKRKMQSPHTCTYMHTCTLTYARTHAHTHIYTHTHMYTHICTHATMTMQLHEHWQGFSVCSRTQV